jgi:hypothetical protein
MEQKTSRIWVYGILAILGFPILLILGLLLPEAGFGFAFAVSIFPSLLFGILAWVTAARGLKALPRESHYRAARRRMTTGLVVGILAVFVVTPFYCTVMMRLLSSDTPMDKDQMISDMVNISANAYQYRLRPPGIGGGGGSYNGYVLPRSLEETEYAAYKVTVFDDSLVVNALFKQDSAKTITAITDSLGKMKVRSITGEFE